MQSFLQSNPMTFSMPIQRLTNKPDDFFIGGAMEQFCRIRGRRFKHNVLGAEKDPLIETVLFITTTYALV